MGLSNWDAYQLYMRDIPSPQSFVDAGYFYIISSCLQRRVWLGQEHEPLFLNMYQVLTGDPGTGKGRVLKQVDKFIRFHKRPNPNAPENKVIDASTEDKAARLVADVENWEKGKDGKAKTSIEVPLQIPMGPTTTTFEAVVEALAKAVQTKAFRRFCDKQNKEIWDYYRYHSLSFCLEELSSLFQKKAESVSKLLLNTYDCGDYEKLTKHHGSDIVRNCCVNLIGGTTPEFMKSSFNSELIGDGLCSRIMFVYGLESECRHDELFKPPLEEKQLLAKAQVLEHIKKLFDLYGGTTYTPEAQEYLTHWYKTIHKTQRANNNPKLKGYYARKNILVQKIAAAKHYGESTVQVIGIEPVKFAIEWCDKIEKNMHHAITFESKNPLAKASRDIVSFLQIKGPQSTLEVLEEFYNDVDGGQLNEVLTYLQQTNKVFSVDMREKSTKKQIKTWYTMPNADNVSTTYPNCKYEKI